MSDELLRYQRCAFCSLPWFVPQIIMREYDFSCWKSRKLLLCLRLVCVTDSGAHMSSLYVIERSGLRGLRGIFIHLAWQSVTKAVSIYMERWSYSQQCWIQCHGSKLWCRIAYGWLGLCSQFAAAGTCLFPSLFSRRGESRDEWCTGHVPSMLLSDAKIWQRLQYCNPKEIYEYLGI